MSFFVTVQYQANETFIDHMLPLNISCSSLNLEFVYIIPLDISNIITDETYMYHVRCGFKEHPHNQPCLEKYIN